MEFKILDKSGKLSKNTHKASDDIFASEFNESLIHQLVTSYMSNGRSVTRAQKTRAAISPKGNR